MVRKKKPNKSKFKKKTLRMKDNHTWQAPEGYKIMVVDRGAASFNIPSSWVIVDFEPLKLHDTDPPDDNARLTVTVWRLSAEVDWSQMPLDDLLQKSAYPEGKERDLEVVKQGKIVPVERDDLQMVWTRSRWIDPIEKRHAYSRIALARYEGIHVLMTFDYWVDDEKKFVDVWKEAIRSLQMGREIQDPTKGAILH